MLEYRSEDERL